MREIVRLIIIIARFFYFAAWTRSGWAYANHWAKLFFGPVVGGALIFCEEQDVTSAKGRCYSPGTARYAKKVVPIKPPAEVEPNKLKS